MLYVASQPIQELLGAPFDIKMAYLMVARKRNHYLCEDGIEKSVPSNQRLSSPGRPCDANIMGQIFQYYS